MIPIAIEPNRAAAIAPYRSIENLDRTGWIIIVHNKRPVSPTYLCTTAMPENISAWRDLAMVTGANAPNARIRAGGASSFPRIRKRTGFRRCSRTPNG